VLPSQMGSDAAFAVLAAARDASGSCRPEPTEPGESE
jgi:hypothetical protein